MWNIFNKKTTDREEVIKKSESLTEENERKISNAMTHYGSVQSYYDANGNLITINPPNFKTTASSRKSNGIGVAINLNNQAQYFTANHQPIQTLQQYHAHTVEQQTVYLLKDKGIRVVPEDIAIALGLSSRFLYEEDELKFKEESKAKKPRKRLKI